MAEPVRVGDVVAGKYRIERELGSGGMGVVVCATHLQLNQHVALKFLVDSGLEAHVAAERFLREARATFRLRSEHTVRVMDVGTLPAGQPFIVMELLEGKDFKQLVADRGPLPPQEAALYMLQVLAALQEAHALGIVHRDLKARNLFLTTRVDGTPCVKVLDFGISKLGEEEAPLTLPDVGLGSPRYMAPEQWTSAATVDARADIYAAGAVLYELVTGQIPLQGLPLAEVIKRSRAGAIPSPKEIRPELPEAMCRAVLKALRPRPEERFPTAMHFAQALREAMPDAENRPRPPKPVMSMTVPTAVVSREALLARAQIEQRLSKAAATPATPDTDDESLSSTLDEAPAASAPPTRAATPGPVNLQGEYEEDLATIVQQSPMDMTAPPKPAAQAAHMATLQVAEAPPEIQALRDRGAEPRTQVSAQRALAPPTPAIPIELPPLDTTVNDPVSRRPPYPMRSPPGAMPQPQPMAMPMPMPMAPPVSLQQPAVATPARGGVPAWLFWTLLVLSFLFAGGVVAALLTQWVQ